MSNRSSWSPLHAHLHLTLRQRKILPPEERLLIAVSGGQDSLCLTKLLLDLQPKWHWHLGIAHCDHRWRDDSQANAEYVEKLAQAWQLPFYLETATVVANNEAAARQWRYQALAAIAINHNYQYIVTGHTASDRSETLLYNLIRGSGADGLSALTWQRLLFAQQPNLSPNIYLVRPLLEITRAQTGQFCQAQDLAIWQDSTNEDLHYARNRIRQQLMPLLQELNPQVEKAIAQTAELLKADVEYLEQAATELLMKVTSPDGALSFRQKKLDRRLLRSVPLALQRRVMRQVLREILPQEPNFQQVEKLTELINAPNKTQTDPFPGGAIARVEQPWIIFVN